jgi:transketolase
LALSRQNLPLLRTRHTRQNLSARGAYTLAEAEGRRRAILLATGSEVQIAMAARERLQAAGIGTRVVSMPCWEGFAAQDEDYRRKVLPPGPVRVGVEAAVRFGWDRWLCGERGAEKKAGFIGMEGFGASGSIDAVYAHFGITPDNVVAQVEALL